VDLDELLHLASPIIGDLGRGFYFTPETAADGEKLGLNLYEYYGLGRGGVLGDVEAGTARAAFGYFEPGVFAMLWEAARAKADPREAGRAYLQSSASYGRLHLSDVDGLADIVACLDAVNDAADAVGLALYAAVKQEPLVDDAPGRAGQLLTVLREHRGSAHLVALRAVGLSDRLAHHLSRPQDAALFGWNPAEPPEVTDEHREMRRKAEAITDDIVRPAFAVLDDAQRTTLADGLRTLREAFPQEGLPDT